MLGFGLGGGGHGGCDVCAEESGCEVREEGRGGRCFLGFGFVVGRLVGVYGGREGCVNVCMKDMTMATWEEARLRGG